MNRGRSLPRVIVTTPLASFPRTSILILIPFTCFAARVVAVFSSIFSLLTCVKVRPGGLPCLKDLFGE